MADKENIRPEDWSVLDHFIGSAAAPQTHEPSRVSSGDWIDALAEKWARRGDVHLKEADEYYTHRPDQYEHFRSIGATWKAASKELRAEKESASIHRI